LPTSKSHRTTEKVFRVPSHSEAKPNLPPEQVNSYTSADHFGQHPHSVGSKMRNMFSWLSPSLEKDNEEALKHADVYHFDHGEPNYYRTTDCPPHLVSDIFAQRATRQATKFWAEIFGSINVLVTFVVTFFLQLFRLVFFGDKKFPSLTRLLKQFRVVQPHTRCRRGNPTNDV
jgi:hypothetical protein